MENFVKVEKAKKQDTAEGLGGGRGLRVRGGKGIGIGVCMTFWDNRIDNLKAQEL